MNVERVSGVGRSVLGLLFRALGLAVLLALLVFPAYKDIWLGYVPVVIGAVLAFMFLKWGQAPLHAGGFRVKAHLAATPRWKFLLLATAGPAAIQLLLILGLRPVPWMDARFVYDQAVSLAGGGVMDPMTYYAPAQIWWFGAFLYAFGPHVLVAQLSLIPLTLGIILLVWRLASRRGNAWRARSTTLFVAYYPSFLFYILTTPYYYYLYTFALTVMAWLLCYAVEQREQSAAAFFAGAAGAWAALTKAVMLLAPALAALFFFLGARQVAFASWFRKGVLFLLGFGVVLGPWVYRNVRVFEAPVLVCTSGGLVLYSANNPTSNGLYSPLPDEVALQTPQAMLAHSRWCAQQAWSFIKERPGRFLELVWQKNLHTWGNETTYAELINRRGVYEQRLDLLFSFLAQTGWALLVMLWAVRGLTELRGGGPIGGLELLTAILVLTDLLVYSVYEGGARHHLPLVPFLALYALGEPGGREKGAA